jgi:hypothetical protein
MSNNMKQTAVEWLATYLKGITSLNCDEVIEQAKAMEKQQIIEAHDEARTYVLKNVWKHDDGKRYYQEIYEK